MGGDDSVRGVTSPDIETIGVLTSGGDCPGLNAVIRGVVRKAEREFGWRTLGFHDGYMGLIEESFEELTIEGCRGILPRGGTVIGTSRYTRLRCQHSPTLGFDVFKHRVDLFTAEGHVGHSNALVLREKLERQRVLLSQHFVGLGNPARQPLRVSPVGDTQQVWTDKSPYLRCRYLLTDHVT